MKKNDTPNEEDDAAREFHRKYFSEAPLTEGELMAAAMDELQGESGDRVRLHLAHSPASRSRVEKLKSDIARYSEMGLLVEKTPSTKPHGLDYGSSDVVSNLYAPQSPPIQHNPLHGPDLQLTSSISDGLKEVIATYRSAVSLLFGPVLSYHTDTEENTSTGSLAGIRLYRNDDAIKILIVSKDLGDAGAMIELHTAPGGWSVVIKLQKPFPSADEVRGSTIILRDALSGTDPSAKLQMRILE